MIKLLFGTNYIAFLQKRTVPTNLLFDGVIVLSLFEDSHRFSALLWCMCFVLMILLIVLWGYPVLERVYKHPLEILVNGNMITSFISFLVYTICALGTGIVVALIGRVLFYKILLTKKL